MVAPELLNLIHDVRHNSVWAVVLVPKSLYREALIGIAALCDEPMTGRTIRWSDRPGKLTVCYAEHDNPVPSGTPFDLYLALWDRSSEHDRWYAKAWMGSATRMPSQSNYNWDQTPVTTVFESINA
jgi:hypothetical protein